MTTYMLLDLDVARLQERVEESYTLTSSYSIDDSSDIVHLSVFDAQKLIFQFSSAVSVLKDAHDELLRLICECYNDTRCDVATASVSEEYHAFLLAHDSAASAAIEYICEVFLSEDAQVYNSLKSVSA